MRLGQVVGVEVGGAAQPRDVGGQLLDGAIEKLVMRHPRRAPEHRACTAFVARHRQQNVLGLGHGRIEADIGQLQLHRLHHDGNRDLTLTLTS